MFILNNKFILNNNNKFILNKKPINIYIESITKFSDITNFRFIFGTQPVYEEFEEESKT